MLDRLVQDNTTLYSCTLLFAFVLALIWELLRPRRVVPGNLAGRWRINFIFPFVNLPLIYFVFPVTAVTMSLLAVETGWGLFNHVDTPPTVAILISFLLMDVANYGQHYLLHRVPILWRIHRAHHSDPEMDVSTSLRFHPLETMVSVGIDLAVIAVIGAPPIAVAAYRIFRVFLSTLDHSNILVPEKVDRLLRFVIVTPDMHRIHHSILEQEHNSNFSGGFVWWDRLFATYKSNPVGNHSDMQIGLDHYPIDRATSPTEVLFDPFSRNVR